MRKQPKNGINSKRVGAALALLSFTAYMPLPAFAGPTDITANTLPDLNRQIGGEVTTQGNRMNVQVQGGQGAVGQFDWNSFNVGSNATVNFDFTANSQTSLNRVLATGGMSEIYGKLTESYSGACPGCAGTGKVILFNPNGILFGNGSQVNLNSFTATMYDVRGAKDLEKFVDQNGNLNIATNPNLSSYFKSLKGIAGADTNVQFISDGKGNGTITISDGRTLEKGIYAEGATFRRTGNTDGTEAKLYALVGDKIDVKNSTIQTQYDSTPNTWDKKSTRSGVKLVTADGVNFYYTNSGNVKNESSKYSLSTADGSSNAKSLSVNNSTVLAGDVDVIGGGKNAEGTVNITNSKIHTKKLVGTTPSAGTTGNIQIVNRGDVNISNSNIQVTNDAEVSNKVYDKNGIVTELTKKEVGALADGGNMLIQSTQGKVKITDSDILSADSLLNDTTVKYGNIQIKAKDDVNITQKNRSSKIVSGGDLTIASSATDVNIDGYDWIQAKGEAASARTKTEAYDKNPNNEPVKANYINVETNPNRNLSRTINLQGQNVNVKNTGLVTAKNVNVDANEQINVVKSNVRGINTKLLASDTTIDNSNLHYADLKLYDDTVVNNVTVKNNSSMYESDSSGVTLVTNGNLTIDNTALNRRSINPSLKDEGTAKFITLESTKGNVTVQNGADVYANGGDVNVKANNDVKVNGASSVWAKNGNVNVTATNGKVSATGKSSAIADMAKIVAEGGTTTITQAKDINLNNDYRNSLVGGTTKLSLKSTKGSVIGNNLVNGTVDINNYKGVKTLTDTSKNAVFTLSNNANIEAAAKIDLTGKGDMEVNNLTTKSGDGTTITAPGKLDVNGLDIQGGDTTLNGDTVKTPNGVINANGNKLAINANGPVDVKVKGVNKKGIDVNADIDTSKGSYPNLLGRTVKIDATDGTLAISKIKADTLDLLHNGKDLNPNNIIAAGTKINPNMDNVNGENGLANSGKPYDSKSYIEVGKDGGFNLDKSTGYDPSNADIYTGNHYNSKDVIKNENKYNYNTPDVAKGEPVVTQYGEWVKYDEKTYHVDPQVISSSTVRVKDGEPVVTTERVDHVYKDGVEGYETITTTTQNYKVYNNVTYQEQEGYSYKEKRTNTTATPTVHDVMEHYEADKITTENQHVATLGGQKDGFVLVYNKKTEEHIGPKDTLVQSGVAGNPITGTQIENKNNGNAIVTIRPVGNPHTEKEFVKNDQEKTTTKTFCEYPKAVQDDRQMTDFDDDVASWVRIPRHLEGTSDNAPIQNDLADTSSAVVAAAARLEVDTDDEDDFLE